MSIQPGVPCQWYSPATPDADEKICLAQGVKKVGVPIAMGMAAKVILCRRHVAEFNRIQAQARVRSRRGDK
jgi:hypothetical protein